MEQIKTIDGVIDAIGGLKKTAALVGQSSPAVCNWQARGRIPPEYFIRISAALAADGKTVSPDVFGMRPPVVESAA